jgi:hypothetical protein
LKLTRDARRYLETDKLWLYYTWGRLVSGIRQPTKQTRLWTHRHGLVDDSGQPFHLVLSRLRKTQKAEWYVKTRGQLEQFAVGHTPQIAATHYANIPALRHIHEQTIADGLADALDTAMNPRLILPEAEEMFRADPVRADLPLPPDEVIAFLDGAQDLWLASCSGFYNSPFTTKGSACPVPFWGCLECRNAVITSRKLPALINFLDFMLTQREMLTAIDWEAKFGRAHRRIVEQILPSFPESVVVAARTIAGSQVESIYLPPEAAA